MLRRNFLASLAACASPAFSQTAPRNGKLTISAIELTELHGRYESTPGINKQYQVNPLHVYDELRPKPYKDAPAAGKTMVSITEIYMRIRTSAGLDGMYGPIDRESAIVIHEQLRPFLIGKDPLAGEALWDQMFRSNRHSRGGFFLMAMSAIDNALWDLRGRYYQAPVYRLLGGPTREAVQVYVSCLGFSLEPDKVRERSRAFLDEGFRHQKWFMGYGPGSGAEGLRKNVELVKILRETVGDDTELMFDAFSGWDLNYALSWAHQVEQYRPRWIEEATNPEKIETFAQLRRSTTIPIASGEHFYGRWEVERYLQANALSVVQADPEWCGGITELVKICTVASVHDVHVIPHGHSLHAALHVIASQNPMTCPLAEYLFLKMSTYYHFEKNPPRPVKGRITLTDKPGFGVELDDAKIERRKTLTWD